ncbi:DUF1513 domain-containing protein [Rhodobacter sp. KR11]|uniref:DUF1513 domain-containing protein n=1 Tax=Rhodobacter sp. KR11 TaxID=2974588 RepID=UPI002222D687|nr:DUF1513 domain-containing protein [Rhodobacter sp. KR11]MCW1917898.1 DUF1513 domain-containing protein [Rhodobacter sp. KR11]
MRPSRRLFLSSLAALAVARPSWADAGSPAWLAAAKEGEDYRLHGLSETGESLFALPLPARGHAAAAHPTRPLAVAFARRPGTYALVIDCVTGAQTHRLTPPPGRQFNGHGAFASDGRVLYTSEVVAEGSEGRIGIWETEGFTRMGEWISGGIGPHDIKLTKAGLIVANGGIQTDPGDRTKLNIDTMAPNLTLLSKGGSILDQVSLPDLPQASIRHLVLTETGVAFAMQWEGDPAEVVPLLGHWVPGSAPVLFAAPEGEAHRMQGYAGSIARARDGRLAISSPKGGAVQVFAPDGTFLATHARADVCGLSALGAGFVTSDGNGGICALDQQVTPLAHHEAAWDNHMVALIL